MVHDEVIAALGLDVSLSEVAAGAGAAARRPAALNTRQHSEHAGPAASRETQVRGRQQRGGSRGSSSQPVWRGGEHADLH